MPRFVKIHDSVRNAEGRVHVLRRAPAFEARAPALVVLGGLTQTVANWGAQARALADGREVVVYEMRGQGRTELGLDDLSPGRHVEDFVAVVGALGLDVPVDLCGFSLGGFAALAVAAEHPRLARRLVLCGVGPGHGPAALARLRRWRVALQAGGLEALARTALDDTFGPAYLERHAADLPEAVGVTVARNRPASVQALLEQAMAASEESSPWHPAGLARRVRCPALVLGGELDPLVAPRELEALARLLGGRSHVFAGVGHTVMLEAPDTWSRQVLAFLDEEPDGAR